MVLAGLDGMLQIGIGGCPAFDAEQIVELRRLVPLLADAAAWTMQLSASSSTALIGSIQVVELGLVERVAELVSVLDRGIRQIVGLERLKDSNAQHGSDGDEE